MSTGRTLSNSTLSLRFMQNAQRAKQQAAIELERAKVKDEAEWEVSKEIREALGLASNSKTGTDRTVVQETSYLPFLFPSLQNSGSSANEEAPDGVATSTRISGRRTFSKGREVEPHSTSSDTPAGEDAIENIKQEANAADLKPIGAPLKERKKPRSAGGPLTGKRTAARLAALNSGVGGPPIGEPSVSDVPVLAMISEGSSAAVGMDIRQIRRLKGKEERMKVSGVTAGEVKPQLQSPPETGKTMNSSSLGKSPLSFLRPTGVDSPAASSAVGKRSKKREREHERAEAESYEANSKSAGKKAGSERYSITSTPDIQQQVPKRRKQQQVKTEPGLSTSS